MLQVSASTTSESTPRQARITERVRGEFREMPGLALTLAQAGRLWGLDPATCADVMDQLVSSGFLRHRPDGAFCRPTEWNSHTSGH